MENEEELYGFSGFPLLEKLKLLAEWAPLLSRLQDIGAAKTPHDQASALVRLGQWAAGRSDSKVDDEALMHIEAMLRTPEGTAFVNWAHTRLFGGAA